MMTGGEGDDVEQLMTVSLLVDFGLFIFWSSISFLRWNEVPLAPTLPKIHIDKIMRFKLPLYSAIIPSFIWFSCGLLNRKKIHVGISLLLIILNYKCSECKYEDYGERKIIPNDLHLEAWGVVFIVKEITTYQYKYEYKCLHTWDTKDYFDGELQIVHNILLNTYIWNEI